MKELSLEERLQIIKDTAEPIKALSASNEIVDLLYGNANLIVLNANDTFGWGCADAVEIMVEDLPKLLEVKKLYGNDGINAFMALVRREDVMDECQNKTYWEAKKFLKDYRPCVWING